MFYEFKNNRNLILQERIGSITSASSPFGSVNPAPLRAPAHSMTELQAPYFPAHFNAQPLSLSTTPVSTTDSRNSGGSSGGSGSPGTGTAINDDFAQGINLTAITTSDPYQVTSSVTPASAASIAATVAASVNQVNSVVFPTSVTASMSEAANHLSSQVRKLQENTLMVCIYPHIVSKFGMHVILL